MKYPDNKSPEETQKLILDILDGKITPVRKHVSRNSNKFHDVS
jgi:hypothetical protein